MSENESFGTEIAKQLPISELYNDLAHPALSTIGKGLQGITKIALAPISGMVWGYDKIAAYLDVAIPEYFAKKGITEDKIKTPDPTIAVPVIEAMRYTSHKKELQEMFVNLLGASMNSDCVDEHPGFIEIIKQLTTDECRMLKYLTVYKVVPMLKIRIKADEGGGEHDIHPYFSNICYIAKCSYPNKFPEYLDNLNRLGLVNVSYDRFLTNDKLYENLRLDEHFPVITMPKDKQVDYKGMFRLSEYGKKFCSICIGRSG